MTRAKEVLEVAGVGHRITHEDDLPKPRTVAGLAVTDVGRRPRGSGARRGADVGRAITLEGEDPGEAPDPCGELEVGSPNTFVGKEKRPVVTADKEIEIACENDSDGPMMTGALTVYVNGKPIVRRTDELDCGAFVGEGEPTVLVGAARQESRELRPNERPLGRTRPRGPDVARQMQRRTMNDGPHRGRAITGDSERRRRRRRPPSGGVGIGRALADRDPVGILRALFGR